MKTVAIIGAGPAGLAAAKHLIHHGAKSSFQVTLFEKQSAIGGMWALGRDDTLGGKCSPNMRVNLSRFTVAFDDLPWSREDIAENADDDSTSERAGKDTSGMNDGSSIPMFPRAWQVGRYLQRYARAFIPQTSVCLGHTVTKAILEDREGCRTWRIQWKTNLDAQGEQNFDYLVVASGFFSDPAAPGFKVSTTPRTGPDDAGQKIIHSTVFRGQSEVLESKQDGPKKIVVVGGSMSGAEAAATAALQISEANHSPSSSAKVQDYQVYHVFNRPFYPIPRFITLPKKGAGGPEDTGPAPDIVPVDLSLFHYGDDRPPKASRGAVPASRAQDTHRFFATLLTGSPRPDEIDLPPEVLHEDHQRGYPPFVAIIDDYIGYIRSGMITPIRGHVTDTRRDGSSQESSSRAAGSRPCYDVKIQLNGNPTGKNPSVWAYTSGRSHGPEEMTLSGVEAVVYATGFEPSSAVDWLPKDVLESLQYDPDFRRMPLVLTQHCTGIESSSNIAFVGFYEGPYWGVMEMQAEYISRKWASDQAETHAEFAEIFPQSPEESQEICSIREAQKKRDPTIPQFWMGDHIGVRREMAAKLAKLPAYGPDLKAVLANHIQMEDRVRSFLTDQVGINYVPAAIFRSLHGRWELKRRLDSKLPGFPSGTFTGIADFHPRKPTATDADEEYLFIESGTLKTNEGFEMQATRRYVYRFKDTPPTITAWFVKSDGKTVDYFFHELAQWSKTPEDTPPNQAGWQAKSEHLCVKDMYYPEYLFRFRGSTVDRFNIKYTVKGPEKDYVSDTWLSRPESR